MGRKIRCFLLEPTDWHRFSLRRYASTPGIFCAPNQYGERTEFHDVQKWIKSEQCATPPASGDVWPHDDPRWPKTCACGYVFKDTNAWQLFTNRVYARQDTGEKFDLHDAPIGAMWIAPWYAGPNNYGKRAPDGQPLMVRCPSEFPGVGRDWCVDSVASNGPGWTRTGTPPNVTARPSILIHKLNGKGAAFHGYLTNGVLEDI